ncbi:MAG: hypothetical protein KDA79_06570 [Planctomycetaceae bacterium]|nr:hypothetical protein [Planctomycetaceae bacterium]
MSYERCTPSWYQHLDRVVRSRHYTWLAEGLGGRPLDEAATTLLTDLRHVCEQNGVDWNTVLEDSARQFAVEQQKLSESEAVAMN